MAQRIILDASGIRVSRPGYDAAGGFSGLLLAVGLRYGNILEHGQVVLTKNITGGNPANPSYNIIASTSATIVHGTYSAPPGVFVFGIRNGLIQYPAIYQTSGQLTGFSSMWNQSVTPGNASTAVSFTQPAPDRQNTVDSNLPLDAMYLIYRKPLAG